MKLSLIYLTALALAIPISFASGEQSTGEKVSAEAREAKTAVKKTGRKIKDKTCEMVNGKLECAADKAKHGMQNAADKTSDKAKEVKDKVE